MFAIDIDGTIAGGGTQGLLDHFREVLRVPLLDVPQDITWAAVFDLPEIVAYRKAHPRRYQRIRDNVMGSLLVLRSCSPIPGSIEQTRRIAQVAPIRYITARGDDPPSQETTKRWLSQSGYPFPEAVTFCRSFLQKITTAVRLSDDHIVMIDDRWRELVAALRSVEENAGGDPRAESFLTHIREHLTIVAYGETCILEKDIFSGVRIFALPSWGQFDERCSILLRETATQGV